MSEKVTWSPFRGKQGTLELSVRGLVTRDGRKLPRLRKKCPHAPDRAGKPSREGWDWANRVISKAIKDAESKADISKDIDPAMSLNTFFENYVIQACKVAGNTPGTIRHKSSRWKKHISPIVGSRSVGSMSESHVDDIRAALFAKKTNPTEANKVLRVYSYVVSIAHRRGLITRRPLITDFSEKVSNNLRNKRLGSDAEDRMLAALPTLPIRDRALVCLGLCLGLRPGEMGTIRREDFDIKNKILIIRRRWAFDSVGGSRPILEGRKGGTAQTVIPLSQMGIVWDTLIVLLDQHRGEWLWGSDPLSRVATRDNLSRLVAPYGGTPYSLRHSCLSRLADRGVSVATIAVLAGHTTKNGAPNINMTQGYLTPSIDALASALVA